MRIRRFFPPTFARRAFALAAGLTLATAALAGCSSEGATTDCGIDECIVTFDRGVEGEANVLGVGAKFVGAEGDKVTVEVAGEQVTLTVGEQGTQVGGLWVSVQRADAEEVELRIGQDQS